MGRQGWEPLWYQGPQHSTQEVKLVQASQNQPGVGIEWMLAGKSESSLSVSSSIGSGVDSLVSNTGLCLCLVGTAIFSFLLDS